MMARQLRYADLAADHPEQRPAARFTMAYADDDSAEVYRLTCSHGAVTVKQEQVWTLTATEALPAMRARITLAHGCRCARRIWLDCSAFDAFDNGRKRRA